MACNIIKSSDGTNTVVDASGNPSALYDDLLQLLSNYPYTTSELIPTDDVNNLALQYYELSNTPEFRSKYNLTSKLDVEVSIDDIINHINTEYSFNETQEVKEGVEDLFESNPELANIGTPEQYSQYLDSVFPNSQVKDIVYHGTKGEKFDKFKSSEKGEFGKGVYFGNYQTALENTDDTDNFTLEPVTGFDKNKIIAAIINTQNIHERDLGGNGIRNEYVVEPEQIRILGGKQDIEGFKQYVDAISAEVVEEEHPIQTAYKAQLEKTGEKPKMVIITGTKAILNSNGTYDLVDPSNNTIMQKNMDLDTMEIIDIPDTSMPYDNEIFDNFVKNTLMHPYTEVMLAERGIDINDIYDELSVITTENELNEIMGKILKAYVRMSN